VAGEGDAAFVAVWSALKAAHERRECYGAAGVGGRAQAWAAWNRLSLAEQKEAAGGVDRYVAWREANPDRGLQEAGWWLKDRSWAKTPTWVKKPASAQPRGTETPLKATSLTQSQKEDVPPQVVSATVSPQDAWVMGCYVWIKSGNCVALPGAPDPSSIATWPSADRDAFLSACRTLIQRHGASTSIRIGRLSSEVGRWLRQAAVPVIGAEARQRMRAATIASLARISAQKCRTPASFGAPTRTLSLADLADYCVEMGV
jgi:hypothetical protein